MRSCQILGFFLQLPNAQQTADITAAVKPETGLMMNEGMCHGEFTSMELTHDDDEKRTALMFPFLSPTCRASHRDRLRLRLCISRMYPTVTL